MATPEIADYISKQLGAITYSLQNFNGDGVTKTFTLHEMPKKDDLAAVWVDNKLQAVGTYSIGDSALTLAVAPAPGVANVVVVLAPYISQTIIDAQYITVFGRRLTDILANSALSPNVVMSFKTKAEASAAAATLPEGQRVEIDADETRDDRRTRYVVNGGALVFEGLSQPAGVGDAERTVQERNSDTISVRDYITTRIDGVTVNQAGIVAAIATALASGSDLYWPRGTYVSDGNIPSFWDVNHIGPGVIKRGEDIFFITPRNNHQNIIYAGAPNLTANDGLSRDLATNISQAVSRVKNSGGKTQAGRWRIQLFGNITSSGVTLQDMPAFKNRLEIWGEAANDVNAVPTTVWDGAASVPTYAIRGDFAYNSANFFLHFKNIKFTNWNKSSNAGGIVIWGSGDVLSENIHGDTCSISEWYRQCYARVTGGRADNCQTYGVQVSYGATCNLGNLSGAGKVFTNCAVDVSVGRQSTCYIQGCDLSGDTLIEVTRNSRIRTQGNIFRAWTRCVVDAQLVGVWTTDNGEGNPDTYLQTPTTSTPVMIGGGGSIHMHLQRLSGNGHEYNANGSLAVVSGTTAQTLLATAAGSNGDFTPARIPSWWAYSPTAVLTVDLRVSLSSGAGGTLTLNGVGTGVVLATLPIPAIAGSGQVGWARLSISIPKSGSTGYYTCEFKSATGVKFYTGSTVSLNSTAIRAASENLLVYRLYWTPENNNQAAFSEMRSSIEI